MLFKIVSKIVSAGLVLTIGVPLVVADKVYKRVRRFLPERLNRAEMAHWAHWHIADVDPDDERRSDLYRRDGRSNGVERPR